MVSKFKMLIQAALLVALLTGSAIAQSVTMIRDADIEHSLKQIAQPLIAAAGLNPNRIKIIVLKDSRLNAFVVDANHESVGKVIPSTKIPHSPNLNKKSCQLMKGYV